MRSMYLLASISAILVAVACNQSANPGIYTELRIKLLWARHAMLIRKCENHTGVEIRIFMIQCNFRHFQIAKHRE